ncbi:MAG: hypothetical protein LBI63_04680 [Candidatus Ancillula sp.]|jgi:predicted amidophosphoribosyltransferase|nr:hypothetical protein [Candidatus Ancillula sp.]
MLKYLMRLIWPLNCAGCGECDVHLCKKCEEVIKTPTLRLVVDKDCNYPIYAAFSYTAAIRRIMLAFKDGGRFDMLAYIRYAVRKMTSNLLTLNELKFENIGCVPAPSSFSSLKRRQMLQTGHLASAIVSQLRAEHVDAIELDILKQHTKKKQVNYSGEQRSKNKSGSVQLKISKAMTLSSQQRTRNIILVDDIITTGSTTRECIRVLENAGFRVLCVIVLCTTGS